MPAHQLSPDITGGSSGDGADVTDPAEILAAEREHLAASRAALRAMREHARSDRKSVV